MNQNDYFQLGTIIRSHGVRGDLIIYMDVDDPAAYRNIKAIFLFDSNGLQEKEVKSIRFNNNLATVHLNGIEDRNTSDLFLKKEVFLPIQLLPELKDKQFYFHEVIGFNLIDKNEGDLGPIVNVYELPQHPVLAIIYHNTEVLIPAVSDFIIDVNREKKIIEMELPEGLLDVYTT